MHTHPTIQPSVGLDRLGPDATSRRAWLQAGCSAVASVAVCTTLPAWAQTSAALPARSSIAERVLILVELKGGNDGLNTVVPFANPLYTQMRPGIALKRDALLPLNEQTALHGALKPLMSTWDSKQLAIIEGVGYPQPNLSHFRSIEIWENASDSNEYLSEGWCTRAMTAGLSQVARFTAQGVLVGGGDFGPLLGAQAVALNNPEAFIAQSKFAQGSNVRGSAALAHLLQVEANITQAAAGLRGEKFAFKTEFPAGGFGSAVRAAAQIVASQRGKPAGMGGVPVIRLSLGSFDTHQNQLGAHANLLGQLAEGLVALQGALTELGAWERSLVLTYSEFGRRPRQNASNGTDHGTAAPHFALGGTVRGGFYGSAPDLTRLDGSQNMAHTTDFRQVYASVVRDWWGLKPAAVVRGPFEPVPFLRA